MKFDLNYFCRVAEMSNRMMPERLIYLRTALAASMSAKQYETESVGNAYSQDRLLYHRRVRETNIAAYYRNLAA